MYANFSTLMSGSRVGAATGAFEATVALDGDHSRQVMAGIRQNAETARNLADFLQSPDPGANLDPATREDLLALCHKIAEHREFLSRGLAEVPAIYPNGSVSMTLPVTQRHATLAREEGIALESALRALAENARHQRTVRTAPLRDALEALKVACEAIRSPCPLKTQTLAENFLATLGDIPVRDVHSLAIGAHVTYASRQLQIVNKALQAARQLADLEVALTLRDPNAGPGTQANRRTWAAALEALTDSRWLEMERHLTSLQRLTTPAPVCPLTIHPGRSDRSSKDDRMLSEV